MSKITEQNITLREYTCRWKNCKLTNINVAERDFGEYIEMLPRLPTNDKDCHIYTIFRVAKFKLYI